MNNYDPVAATLAVAPLIETIALRHVDALPPGTPTIGVSSRAIGRLMSAKLADVTGDAFEVGDVVIAHHEDLAVACRVRSSQSLAMNPSRSLTQLAPVGSFWADEIESAL